MNTKEHAFLITSYCNTPEKVQLLKDCILQLNKYENTLDILVYAHYPLPFEIQNMVKYYIYDSTNPKLDMSIKFVRKWILVTPFLGYDSRAMTEIPDTGFAVLSMWDKGMKFLKSQGYKYAHILDYDLDVYSNLYENVLQSNLQKLTDGIEAICSEYFYDWHLDLTNAAFNIDVYFEKIFPLISLDEYLLDKLSGIEYYLGSVIKKSNINHELINVKIDNFSIEQGIYKNKLNEWLFWCGRTPEDRIIVIIYDNINTIKKLKVEVSGDNINEIIPDIETKSVVIDITDGLPKYIKILEYNDVVYNHVILSNIDDEYLKNHYIQKI